MFELFSDGPIHEYPQIINIAYSFIWAFLLAAIVAITHRVTYTGDNYPKNFFQSLILGAVVTTMVMMAIGDSLARGLGVFGAMAIIRFRTRIDDPRDVLFLFAALSTGLAIGVYGFTISFVGAVLFCLVALVLHVSPFRSVVLHHKLYFTLADAQLLTNVQVVLAKYCIEARQDSIQLNKENEYRYQYSLSLKKEIDKGAFLDELQRVTGLKQIRLALNEQTNL